jgi:hypothetical protein
MGMKITCVVAGAGLLLFAAGGAAQENADELAKKISNPVSSLISVPMQLNWDTDIGPSGDGERYTLNVQPVIPVSISADWNLISRTIVPLIDQSDIFAGAGSQSGLGDVLQSIFFSPKAPTARGLIWGAGPVLLLPTASDDLLGTEKWGIGPTAVVLTQTPGGLTYGALVNHVESVAGDDDRVDVSRTFLQPFLAQALGRGRTVTFNFESTYDWEEEQWTAPFNVAFSQVLPIGTQLVSLAAGARYYVVAPAGGPEWGLRLEFRLLYPKRP